jgi:cytochrome c biogenesis protein CcmG/thiol:disulfide interchange protein DsbE
VAVIALVMVSALGTALNAAPAAAEETAKTIFELAQKLFKHNADVQGYTYWVGGNIGLPEDAQRPTGLVPGKTIPDFTFRDFNSTDKVTNADLKGPYILNFWASWCGPCRNEFPLFAEVIKSGRLTAPVYFINTGELTKSAAQYFLLQYASDVTVYSDTRSRFGKATGIEFIPVTVLVDEAGIIQALHPGEVTEPVMNFFIAIAANPGVGGFDWKNPSKMPAPKK